MSLRVRLGGLAWIAALQFFVVEAIVASASPDYSYRNNFISDLGLATTPRHALAQGSFLLQGGLIFVGLAAAWPVLGQGRLAKFGKFAVAVCAAGLALVGVAAEDAAPGVHYAAAAVHIVGCNFGALALGLAAPRGLLRTGIVAGVLGLTGAALILAHGQVLGRGAVERLSVYPFLIWLSANGVMLALAGPPAGVVQEPRRSP